jgi:hypothetical protein
MPPWSGKPPRKGQGIHTAVREGAEVVRTLGLTVPLPLYHVPNFFLASHACHHVGFYSYSQ